MTGFEKIFVSLIFFISFVPSWYAWKMARPLGTALPNANRFIQKMAFTSAVWIGVFGLLVYVVLQLGSFVGLVQESAKLTTTYFWFPIGILVWAFVTYKLLQWKTLSEVQHEESS